MPRLKKTKTESEPDIVELYPTDKDRETWLGKVLEVRDDGMALIRITKATKELEGQTLFLPKRDYKFIQERKTKR